MSVIAALPNEIAAEVAEAHRALVEESRARIAVRTSAATEDAEDASFAGLQVTFWVKEVSDTLRLLKYCRASLYSIPSISYRRKHGMEENGVALATFMPLSPRSKVSRENGSWSSAGHPSA